MMRFRGDSLSEFYGVDSEIGQLRTVLVHRPGAELRRVTPQHTCGMLLPALPWAERAQAEHDAFTAALRSRGVGGLALTAVRPGGRARCSSWVWRVTNFAGAAARSPPCSAPGTTPSSRCRTWSSPATPACG